jgi:hypothetical protein
MNDLQTPTPGDPAVFPAARSQQVQAPGPTSNEQPNLSANFRQAQAPDTWTTEAAYPADSSVPYTLTPKAEALLGEAGLPTLADGEADAQSMTAHDPQAGSGLPGQPYTYITKISLTPSDSGIHRLHVRMKEPDPQPEAGL